MAPSFRQKRGIFRGLGIITLLVIITVIGFSVFMNARCQSAFWDHLAVYPGAVKLEEEAVFLGVQRVVYHSADAPEAINQWYAAQNAAENAAQMREQVLSGDFGDTGNAATPNWVIETDGQGGSTIMQAAICPSGSPTF